MAFLAEPDDLGTLSEKFKSTKACGHDPYRFKFLELINTQRSRPKLYVVKIIIKRMRDILKKKFNLFEFSIKKDRNNKYVKQFITKLIFKIEFSV
jgi:hypothetical protein